MKKFLPVLFLVMALLFSDHLSAASLTPGAPVELTGTQGRFDFIKVDAAKRRLLACHTQNGSLDVIDIDAGKLIKCVPTGNAQGVAIDDKGGRYFVSVSKPPKLVIIDSTKLAVIGEVALPGPADVMAYHPGLNRAFVCNDDKPELWIIDPEAKAIVTTLNMPGFGMEDLGFNADGSLLFQNLKDTGALVKIDPVLGKVEDKWPTTPADKPHGLAMVDEQNAVLIAGGTGKLVLLDLVTGKILASADIAPKVDEIAYDPGLHQAYCASGTGVISVVDVERGALKALDSVPSAQGAHSIAVDPKTHTVWIVFAKETKPYAQPFTAKP